MSAKTSEPRREQIRAWLRAGKSITEVQRAAEGEGWTVSRATVSGLRQEVVAEGAVRAEAADAKVIRRVKEEQAAPRPRTAQERPESAAGGVDLVALLQRRLEAAERVAEEPELSVRDQVLIAKTCAQLAEMLRDEVARRGEAERKPRVVFYFPEKVELRRLEFEEEAGDGAA